MWTGQPAASGDGRSARSVPLFRFCPLLLALSPLIAAAAEPPGAPLQATDWRDHIRYFVMLDRFDDGDVAAFKLIAQTLREAVKRGLGRAVER